MDNNREQAIPKQNQKRQDSTEEASRRVEKVYRPKNRDQSKQVAKEISKTAEY